MRPDSTAVARVVVVLVVEMAPRLPPPPWKSAHSPPPVFATVTDRAPQRTLTGSRRNRTTPTRKATLAVTSSAVSSRESGPSMSAAHFFTRGSGERGVEPLRLDVSAGSGYIPERNEVYRCQVLLNPSGMTIPQVAGDTSWNMMISGDKSASVRGDGPARRLRSAAPRRGPPAEPSRSGHGRAAACRTSGRHRRPA